MLTTAPTNFFMTLRDVGFWVRSARADARFKQFQVRDGPRAAFDQLYAAESDPYGAEIAHYRYQRRKYQSMLSMLPLRPYREALDIGCGVGTFARMLAPFTQNLLGTDISIGAVDQARALSTSHANLSYAPVDILNGHDDVARFDLIVLADTLYYIAPLTDARLASIAQRAATLLAPGGLLMLVNHYFFGVDQASRATRRIHDRFCQVPPLRQVAEHRRAFFLATLMQAREKIGLK